ncbi:MAG TPA: hypothetical protein VE777_05435 [Gaiellales bacterium]|nr:hypothetical protein [Gaiellales bacterium]
MSRKRTRRVEQTARVVDPLSWRPPPQMLELRVFARDEVDADEGREWVERGEEAGAVVEVGRLATTRVAIHHGTPGHR